MDKIGAMAYLVGIGAAVVAGLVPSLAAGLPIGLILLLAGLAVGWMNVTANEGTKFLVALVAMPIAAQAAAGVPAIGAMLGSVINNITAFSAAAAVVVVLKTITDVAKR